MYVVQQEIDIENEEIGKLSFPHKTEKKTTEIITLRLLLP